MSWFSVRKINKKNPLAPKSFIKLLGNNYNVLTIRMWHNEKVKLPEQKNAPNYLEPVRQ
jgi:hypothetical protein